jgi:ribosomal protein S12 methylthiotransferase accessory factor
MEIKVNFLDKLRLEAKFDDFTTRSSPTSPSATKAMARPFQPTRLFFSIISAVCRVLREIIRRTRNISTENIRLSQNNIVDPDNRYQQQIFVQVELPADISAKTARMYSIDRCTVKKKWYRRVPNL